MASQSISPPSTPLQGLTVIDSLDLRTPEGFIAKYEVKSIGSYLPEGISSLSGNDLRKTLLDNHVEYPCGITIAIDYLRSTYGFGEKKVFLFGDTYIAQDDEKHPKDPVVLYPSLSGGGNNSYYPRSLNDEFFAGEYVLLVRFVKAP